MTKRLFVLLILVGLSACGGGDGFVDSGTATTTTGTTTATGGSVSIGSGTGATFAAGSLALGVNPLSAGGSTSVTVNLVDQAGNIYTSPVAISFSSPCAGLGLATLTSPVTTANGTATSTYVAVGCSGNDIITATATIGTTTVSATATINVLPASLGSIQFVSATPATIALQGTGGAGLQETSTVIFKVLDQTGGPVANETVNFTLNTTVGGLGLTPASATTDIQGQVQTVVQSGTVPTAVRVTATVAGSSPVISTQSDQLAVSTGIPDQNSFSVAIETLNPEAWETNGVTVPVTIFVADHFNNPAPDGTAVSFQTEGGFIDGSCTTVVGQCTVNWVSDDPRPADGRVTILATAVGEEGFSDLNGNGLFDDAAVFPAPVDTFVDLPEAWRDDDEDGIHDAGEEFLDYNVNGVYDVPDLFYNGTLCAHSSLCSPTSNLLHVRSTNVLVMASRAQTVVFWDPVAVAAFPIAGGFPQITLPTSGVRAVDILIQDARGQVPPINSSFGVTTDIGVVTGATSFTMGNTNAPGPLVLSVGLTAEGTETHGDVGFLDLDATLGSSATKSGASAVITIADITPPLVTETEPAAGTVGVATTTLITATFDSDMAPATIIAANFTVNGGVVADFVTYDPAAKKAIFVPNAALAASTVYTATVTTGMTDVAGNALAADFSWQFRTAP